MAKTTTPAAVTTPAQLERLGEHLLAPAPIFLDTDLGLNRV